jgi:hypothetical protein
MTAAWFPLQKDENQVKRNYNNPVTALPEADPAAGSEGAQL